MGSTAGTVTEAGAIRPIPRADGLISASPPAIGAKKFGKLWEDAGWWLGVYMLRLFEE
jgi:hypothetical protein